MFSTCVSGCVTVDEFRNKPKLNLHLHAAKHTFCAHKIDHTSTKSHPGLAQHRANLLNRLMAFVTRSPANTAIFSRSMENKSTVINHI